MWQSQIFLKKSPLGKIDQKWAKVAQKRGFGLFKEITSLILSGICVKWKFFWFINILWKLHAWEKYSQKWLSANEISVFFNHQYFTNRLISDFDFWHVDRHEWKKQGSLAGFLKKKKTHLGKWAILDPKIAHPRNSGSAWRIFKKFAQWKGLIGTWEWY